MAVAENELAGRTADCQNRTTKGADYTGTANVTVDNKECQAWAEIPANHTLNGFEVLNLCRLDPPL